MPRIRAIRDVLAEPFRARGRPAARLLAMLDVFLAFHTWRVLTGLLSQPDAVEAAVLALRNTIVITHS